MRLFAGTLGFLDICHVAAIHLAKVGPRAFHAFVQQATSRIEQHHETAQRKREQPQVDQAESRFTGHAGQRRNKIKAFQEKPEQNRKRKEYATRPGFANDGDHAELRQEHSKNKSRSTEIALEQEIPNPDGTKNPRRCQLQALHKAHAVTFGANQQVHKRQARQYRPDNEVDREKRPAPFRNKGRREIKAHDRMHPEHQRE